VSNFVITPSLILRDKKMAAHSLRFGAIYPLRREILNINAVI